VKCVMEVQYPYHYNTITSRMNKWFSSNIKTEVKVSAQSGRFFFSSFRALLFFSRGRLTLFGVYARRHDATAINAFALVFPDASRMGIAVRSVPCPTVRITARINVV